MTAQFYRETKKEPYMKELYMITNNWFFYPTVLIETRVIIFYRQVPTWPTNQQHRAIEINRLCSCYIDLPCTEYIQTSLWNYIIMMVIKSVCNLKKFQRVLFPSPTKKLWYQITSRFLLKTSPIFTYNIIMQILFRLPASTSSIASLALEQC